MGWIEISLLVLASLVLAANQALKDAPVLTSRLQWLRPQPWWSYVPLACVCAAALVFGLRHLAVPGVATPVSLEEDARGAWKIDGLDLDRMNNFFEGRTEYETKLLLEPFRGSEVHISGAISDISPLYDDMGMVSFVDDGRLQRPFAIFQGEAYVPVKRLAKGQIISAKCELDSFKTYSINLEKCRLTPPKL